MNTVEFASRILTQLGFYQEPSKELGVYDRRDNIVHLIEEYTHPVKEQLTDEEIADFLYAYCLDMGDVYEASEEQFIKCVRAILRKAQE